jgi:hypothetical protein
VAGTNCSLIHMMLPNAACNTQMWYERAYLACLAVVVAGCGGSCCLDGLLDVPHRLEMRRRQLQQRCTKLSLQHNQDAQGSDSSTTSYKHKPWTCLKNCAVAVLHRLVQLSSLRKHAHI